MCLWDHVHSLRGSPQDLTGLALCEENVQESLTGGLKVLRRGDGEAAFLPIIEHPDMQAEKHTEGSPSQSVPGEAQSSRPWSHKCLPFDVATQPGAPKELSIPTGTSGD